MGREPTYDELKHGLIICLEAGVGAYHLSRLRMYPAEELNVASSMGLTIRDEPDSKVFSVYHKLPTREGMGS